MNLPAPNRRDFLRAATLGGLAALLPGRTPAAEAAAWPRTVGLGGTLRVPLLGLGTGVRAGNRSNQLFRNGPDVFEATIRRAWDEGVRLFDCADSYGSLPHVGRALKDKPRDSYVLVSKVWCHAKGGIPEDEPRDNATAVVERFLKEAGSDHIYLVQVHCQTHADWPARYRRQMDQLEDCKQRGLIKAHGCSCHTLEALSAAADELSMNHRPLCVGISALSSTPSTVHFLPIFWMLPSAFSSMVVRPPSMLPLVGWLSDRSEVLLASTTAW